MSSPPSPRTFEGWIAEDFGEAALTRPDVMALLEPYREHVEHLLDAFEEDEQSWRDYCGCIYGWSAKEDGAVPHRVYEAALALARSPAPPSSAPTPAPMTDAELAALEAHSCTAIEARLLAKVRRLRALVATLRELQEQPRAEVDFQVVSRDTVASPR